MEAGEYGLTRGTCFVERRLEVVAVAGLLWIFSWCVLGVTAGFRFSFSFFFFEVHGLMQVRRPPCVIYLFTSNASFRLPKPEPTRLIAVENEPDLTQKL